MTAEHADVIVVGLGPAGASAAAESARRGLHVLAVDRRRVVGQPVQCAEFVPALITVEASTLSASMRQPIRSMTTTIECGVSRSNEDFSGHIIDRAGFDAELVAVAVRAGAHCRMGTSVRAITGDGRVLLADGRGICAPVIVGADGPRSKVGRWIGQVNRELLETRQITVPLLQRHFATDIFLAADIPGGYGWLFPKRDVAHVGAGVDPDRKAHLKTIVSALHAALIDEGRVGSRILSLTGGAIPAGGLLKPRGMVGDSLVLLAGDAAGLTNPVTGAGIAAAISSGTLAGEAAATWIAGDCGAAAAYEDELRALFQPALERALARRRERAARRTQTDAAVLRRGWIAFPEYWA